MLRYAITDGEYVIGSAARWAAESIDFVQLRDKTLPTGPLADVGRAILGELCGSATKLLINARCDVAAAIDAHGVHLTGNSQELTPQQVRRVFEQMRRPQPVVSVSCHTLEDVARARDADADLILFGPVFEKRVAGEVLLVGVGVHALREACEAAGGVPVLALGGVTGVNAALCVQAGARGVAGIRLFR